MILYDMIAILLLICLIWYVKGWLFLARHKGNAFDRAWFLHQKRAWHHWQSWGYPDTNGNLRVLSIPKHYCKEMLADWRGAARAQGLSRDSVSEWYATNQSKMLLHLYTKAWFDEQLT